MKVIYMDLDGVAANWDKAAMGLFGFHDREQTYWDELVDLIAERYGVDKRKATGIMWSRINKEGADWWESFEFYEMGLELYEACWAVAPVVFVTSPSTDPSSAAGKMAWVNRMSPAFTELRHKKKYHFDQYAVKTVKRCLAITPAKAMLAGPGKLLIDDRDINCRRFEAAGGTTVLWPQPWNKAGHGLPSAALVNAQLLAIEAAVSWAQE
jgi:hypothetical protein